MLDGRLVVSTKRSSCSIRISHKPRLARGLCFIDLAILDFRKFFNFPAGCTPEKEKLELGQVVSGRGERPHSQRYSFGARPAPRAQK